ncbi:glycosyltransferase [Pseudoalteromonas sp. McH1-7]|uniref:glycosyltransferase n=1 Tax=Pseudoalteromonas sp. McH1-7 TaxID=2745574 RepID=UPI001592054C|nr:glycosyltransferase [Pseudoalteromonas sp. McH1-7]NUZ10658.1 glycosyltransferase [Pseudoalteromonas sp. McH1-7]
MSKDVSQLKVLFLSKNIPVPGFRENNIILRQVQLLQSAGVKVTVFYPRELLPFIGRFFRGRAGAISKLPSDFSVEAVPVSSFYYFRLPKLHILEWLFVNCLSKILNRRKYDFIEKFDIIHSHFVFPDAIIGCYLSKKFNIPHVVTLREGDYINLKKSKRNKILFDRVLESVDKVVLMTPSLSRGIEEKYYKKITTIPSFINADYFDLPSSKEVLPDAGVNFVCVANFISRKNIDWLLEYFEINVGKNISLTICGEGSLFDKYKGRAKFDSRIQLLGYQDTGGILEVLDSGDIFALPSDNESFGLVYAEAASRKNLVVGKKGTGLYGINQAGFFFCEDKADFFFILDYISNLKKEKIEALKEANFRYAQCFSPKQHLKLLSDLYTNVNGAFYER